MELVVSTCFSLDSKVHSYSLVQEIISARDPKQCCKEHEEEVLRYQARFCKFPL